MNDEPVHHQVNSAEPRIPAFSQHALLDEPKSFSDGATAGVLHCGLDGHSVQPYLVEPVGRQGSGVDRASGWCGHNRQRFTLAADRQRI